MDMFDGAKWTRCGDTCVPRCTSGMCVVGEAVYLMGGVTPDGATAHCEVCVGPEIEEEAEEEEK